MTYLGHLPQFTMSYFIAGIVKTWYHLISTIPVVIVNQFPDNQCGLETSEHLVSFLSLLGQPGLGLLEAVWNVDLADFEILLGLIDELLSDDLRPVLSL